MTNIVHDFTRSTLCALHSAIGGKDFLYTFSFPVHCFEFGPHSGQLGQTQSLLKLGYPTVPTD